MIQSFLLIEQVQFWYFEISQATYQGQYIKSNTIVHHFVKEQEWALCERSDHPKACQSLYFHAPNCVNEFNQFQILEDPSSFGRKRMLYFRELIRIVQTLPCKTQALSVFFTSTKKRSSNLQKSTKLTFNAWITVKTWCVITKCRALWGARSTPLVYQVLRAKLLMLSAWQDSSDGVSAGGSPPLAHWVRNARIAPCG